jgi:hypothetical protein
MTTNLEYMRREQMQATVQVLLYLNLGSSYADAADITEWVRDIAIDVTEGTVDTSGDTSGQLIDKIELLLDNTRGDFNSDGRFFNPGLMNNSKIKIISSYTEATISGGVVHPGTALTPYVFNGILKSDSSFYDYSGPDKVFKAGILQSASIMATEIVNFGYVESGISLAEAVLQIMSQRTITNVLGVSGANINLGFDVSGCVDSIESLTGMKVLDAVNAIGILSNSKWYVDQDNNFIMEPIKNSGTSSWDISIDDIISIDEVGYNPLQFNSFTWDDGTGSTGSSGTPGPEGTSGPSVWGGITGDISTQIDLQSALNAKEALIIDIIVCSESLTAGDFVNIYNSSGLKCRKADASTIDKKAHGFILWGCTSGQNAIVYRFGKTNNQLSGLTIGAEYFLSSSGGISLTAPTSSGSIVQIVGVALSATELLTIPELPTQTVLSGTGYLHITSGIMDTPAELTTANVPDSTDRRYCTDAQKVVIGNTSGTNTGDSSTPAETTTSIGALINGATDKSTPVDADYIGLMDSADSNILKKLSWSNIKATLKTYFDTFYAVLGASPSYFTPASPTNLTSNSFLMFGLGSTFAITPVKSGKVRFTIKYGPGGVGITALNSFKIAYGTGAAPANGAAATGTVVGGTDQGGAFVSANGTPSLINRNVIVTGLTLNTAYWFDIQGAKNASHTSVGMGSVEATLEELPY